MKRGELNQDARQVIAAGRAGLGAPELVRARVRRSVAGKLASGAVALSLVHSSSLLAAGAKLGAVVALAGGVGAGTWYAFDDAPAEGVPPRQVSMKPVPGAHTAPERTPAVTPAADVQAADAVTPRVPEAEPAARRATAPRQSKAALDVQPQVETSGSLADEVALLADASARLNQGDAAGAQRLLRQYDRKFQKKMLVQERTATGVLVQCSLGNVQAAQAAAKRFHELWPRSPLASRILGSCAGDAIER